MNDPAFGYHRIGDYHWYNSYENSNYVDYFDESGKLKEGKTFSTHEDLQGLITLIHESYHLIQDLTFGHCAWMQFNNEEYGLCVYLFANNLELNLELLPGNKQDIYRKEKIQESLVLFQREAEFLNDSIYSSWFTDIVINAEILKNKSAGKHLTQALGLTGQDLVECHAAILTERYMAWLIKTYPGAFNTNILKDVEECYFVEKIRSTQKVLKILRDYIPIDYSKANKQHPLYPICKNASEYGFYLLLLHSAMNTFPLTIANADTQDLLPVIRFLKLAGSVLPCILSLEDRTTFTLNEDYLYFTFMPKLVEHINMCNEKAGKASSFLDYDEITKKWLDEFQIMSEITRSSGLYPLYGMFQNFRLRALKTILTNPLYIYKSSIASLVLDFGFTAIASTNNKVEPVYPGYYIVQIDEVNGRKVPYIVPSPYELMDTFVSREIFWRISDSIINGTIMACPVIKRLEYYPCKVKSDKCLSIHGPSEIPQCLAHEVMEKYYQSFLNIKRSV